MLTFFSIMAWMSALVPKVAAGWTGTRRWFSGAYAP